MTGSLSLDTLSPEQLKLMEQCVGPKPTPKSIEEEKKNPNSPLHAIEASVIAVAADQLNKLDAAIREVAQQVRQATAWLLENRLNDASSPAKRQEIERIQQERDALQGKLQRLQETQKSLLIERNEAISTSNFVKEWETLESKQIDKLAERLHEDAGVELSKPDLMHIKNQFAKPQQLMLTHPEFVNLEGKEAAQAYRAAEVKADFLLAINLMRTAQGKKDSISLEDVDYVKPNVVSAETLAKCSKILKEQFAENRKEDAELLKKQHNSPYGQKIFNEIGGNVQKLTHEAEAASNGFKRTFGHHQPTQHVSTAPKPLSTELKKGQ